MVKIKFNRIEREMLKKEGMLLEKIQHRFLLILLILFVGISLIQLKAHICERAILQGFTEIEAEGEKFRNFEVGEGVIKKVIGISKEYEIPKEKLLATVFFDYQYDLKYMYGDLVGDGKAVVESYQMKKKYREKELENLAAACKAILFDVKYFPVAASSINSEATLSYENGWMAKRTYGGERSHEGTDIMAGINERGYYPIISMTDGTVEKVGWLPQGGYRIGIRSPSGGYFYYAHLASYAKEFEEGEKVEAGDLLGMMGDTGYSEVEGTTGMFDVHLHLGIYIKTENYDELSVNPYYVLKYIEDERLEYEY